MTPINPGAAEAPAEYAVPAPALQTATAIQTAKGPDLPLEQHVSVSYSGWRLNRQSTATAHAVYVAFKEDDAAHEHPALRLVASDTVLCEGYWPFRPTWEPRVILGGVCLYTAAWAVRFAAAADDAPPRPLSLALPGDLERILYLLKKGRSIAAIQLPTKPGLYHQRLIRWQAEVLARFPSVEAIHYTLPVPDYHGYIQYFEAALGQPLPGLHAALDAYAQSIKDYQQQVWGDLIEKVHYDTPGSPDLKKVNTASRENDLQLYLLAVKQVRVMGMEDLPEVALAHEVARRTGILIPCAVCVLGLPDPYFVRDDASYTCQQALLAELR
jgi:hypothetical protein